jgi:hypothetical protein
MDTTNDQIINYYIYALIIPFGLAYFYFFYYTIREGNKRGILGVGLIIFALIGSPFFSAAFVSITKRDSDRIKVSYTDANGSILTSSFTGWLKLRLPASSLQKVEDINDRCHYCGTVYKNHETICSACNKKRKFFVMEVLNTNTKTTDYVPISKLLSVINNQVVIKGVVRRSEPI